MAPKKQRKIGSISKAHRRPRLGATSMAFSTTATTSSSPPPSPASLDPDQMFQQLFKSPPASTEKKFDIKTGVGTYTRANTHINTNNNNQGPTIDLRKTDSKALDDIALGADFANRWLKGHKFKPLLDWSQSATADGDALGAYYLGILLAEGRAIAPAPAQSSVGTPTPVILRRGEQPGPPDYHNAFRLWTFAADQGHVESQHRLGLLHFEGQLARPGQVKPHEGVQWAGPGGRLASIHFSGELGPDPQTAVKWLTKAAEQGHLRSQRMLGQIYHDGKLGAPDYAAAAKWFTMAADRGSIPSQHLLGKLYRDGKLGAPDYEAAVHWFTQAASTGHVMSQSRLAGIYYDGHLGAPNYEMASQWFSLAAHQGDHHSSSMLGGLHYDGKLNADNAPDYETAINWFTLAANQGNLHAPHMLGKIYSRKNEYDVAAKWFTKAAERGHLHSQASLGDLYYDGNLGTPDYNEAVKWFTKAAERGSAHSAHMIGKIHLNGSLGAPDHAAASKWFTKAAAQGHAPSQRALLHCHTGN